MNKEIKFRAQSVNTDKWHYGYFYKKKLILDMGIQCLIVENDIHYIVKPESVGEYTGLKDKNGKEIYEGDIVNAAITIEVNEGDDFDYYNTDENGNKKRISCSLKPAVVEYTEIGYVFKHHSGKTTPFWVGTKDIKEKYEKIGNIYENPELINQQI